MTVKLIAVGVGPGDPELITLKALRRLREAELVLVPLSRKGRSSVAQEIVSAHLDIDMLPFVFPMDGDDQVRTKAIADQIETLRPLWQGRETIALPVIGDAALYATAAYLYDVWKGIEPDLSLELIPGVSAHSLAASRVGAFLALGEDRLALLPGTGDLEGLTAALAACDVAALYKASALKEHLPSLVERTGPWKRMVRVERAGLADERILEGPAAAEATGEYLSTLLLWR
ncbi:precorrin-2 C(20)-methyltransferase [Aminithiophilus ramosus]|uniref:Precorrin-2 C(20)-methyltransferase n=1 Tax=Aminithiophilus ramosus TaxID=3029084 RepID=A0A9Q7A9X5_9BACT|nr:precorrin-2 C(20)-methyltransferase [Aminithiophilus ramosus]QTX32986.1 precorrin-2 C(20)-methyltransferase [Aminithiophilus ramosus]